MEPIVSATFEQPRTPQNYVRRLLVTFGNVGGAQLVPLELFCKRWRTFATVGERLQQGLVRASGTHPRSVLHRHPPFSPVPSAIFCYAVTELPLS